MKESVPSPDSALRIIDEKTLEEAVEFYRKHQRAIYSEYLALFPHVKETLFKLKEKGKVLGIVTSRTGP